MVCLSCCHCDPHVPNLGRARFAEQFERLSHLQSSVVAVAAAFVVTRGAPRFIVCQRGQAVDCELCGDGLGQYQKRNQSDGYSCHASLLVVLECRIRTTLAENGMDSETA